MSSVATKGCNRVGSLRQNASLRPAGRPGWRPMPLRLVIQLQSQPRARFDWLSRAGGRARAAPLPDPVKVAPHQRLKRRDRLLPKTLAVRENCEE